MAEAVKHDTVFDDESMHVGQIYANALLAAAGADGTAETIVEQLTSLVRDCFDKQPDVEAALANPKLNVDAKIALIDRVFGKLLHPTLLKFLKVVARRRRWDSLRSIQQTVEKIRNEQSGRLNIFVTTAQPLDRDQAASLRNKLKEVFRADVSISEKVDPSILGGLLVRVGDTVYDGSVDGQLKQLKQATLSRAESVVRERFGSLAN